MDDTPRWRHDLACGHHLTIRHHSNLGGYVSCPGPPRHGQQKITGITQAGDDPGEARQQPGEPGGADSDLFVDPPADLEPGEYRQAE